MSGPGAISSKEQAALPAEITRGELGMLTARLILQGEEIERLQAKLKRYEPVNTYDGRDIDSWRSEALRLRAALEKIAEFDCRPDEHVGELKCWSCYANEALIGDSPLTPETKAGQLRASEWAAANNAAVTDEWMRGWDACLVANRIPLATGSLLRPASTQAPPGCYCTDRCAAPVVMGRQTPCRDPEKAARFAQETSADPMREKAEKRADKIHELRESIGRILSMAVTIGCDAGHAGIEAECRKALEIEPESSGKASTDGWTIECENCTAKVVLPYTGANKTHVDILPAHGWELAPRHLCPQCQPENGKADSGKT